MGVESVAILVNVTDYSFDPEVLKCDIPVLADFWAEWCMPCLALEPYLQEIAVEYQERLKIVKLDIEHNPNVTAHYNVLTIPTLILFKTGLEVERLNGAQSKASLLEKILPHLDG
jgi:thioredoxin 1